MFRLLVMGRTALPCMKGMPSDQAMGLVQARRVGLSKQRDMYLVEMIPLATKLSRAKEEFAKCSK